MTDPVTKQVSTGPKRTGGRPPGRRSSRTKRTVPSKSSATAGKKSPGRAKVMTVWDRSDSEAEAGWRASPSPSPDFIERDGVRLKKARKRYYSSSPELDALSPPPSSYTVTRRRTTILTNSANSPLAVGVLAAAASATDSDLEPEVLADLALALASEAGDSTEAEDEEVDGDSGPTIDPMWVRDGRLFGVVEEVAMAEGEAQIREMEWELPAMRDGGLGMRVSWSRSVPSVEATRDLMALEPELSVEPSSQIMTVGAAGREGTGSAGGKGKSKGTGRRGSKGVVWREGPERRKRRLESGVGSPGEGGSDTG